jgi:hypothetical protein
MSSKTIKRPAVRARNWAWKDHDRNETPGIALWGSKGLTAHLTYTEARTLADALHDLVDALENHPHRNATQATTEQDAA